MSKTPNYNQGRFILPEDTKNKYVGSKDNIYYRSSWELLFMRWLSRNKNVISWNSEEVVINYYNPVKNRFSLYYMDFWFKLPNPKNPENHMQFLVEVKPYKETQKPEIKETPTGKITKKRKETYIYESNTYITNMAKWEATKKFVMKEGMTFFILTEDPNKNTRNCPIYKLWELEELGIYF